MTNSSQRWGGKIGPRIAMLVSQAIVYTHARLLTVKHRLAMSVFRAISDEISSEVDTVLGPVIKTLHSQLDESHPAYPLIDFMLNNHGQLKALSGSSLAGAGLTAPIASILNDILAPYVYNVLRGEPRLLPDTSIIVGAYAANMIGLPEAVSDIESNGIQTDWAKRMLELGRSWPGVVDAIEFARRHLITTDQFRAFLEMNGIPEGLTDTYLQLTGTPLSPADLALAVLRGDMSQDSAISQASESGVSPEQFGVLIGNTGEPPGLMQLLEGYRRGFIDQETLRKGILQSRYRDEWIPLLEKLRYEPMSVADAVNAVVQAHMSMAEGAKIADLNGLEPGMFETLYETAGEPLSRTEMEDLYNRGMVSKAQVIQALRESRLKNKYNEQAFDLHEKILPIYTLQRALRYGGVTHEDAVKIAMESGYGKDSATMIVNAGSAERLQTYKDRVVSSVQSLYEDNVISQAQANQITTAMGYAPEEATFILRSSEFRREAKVINQVVNAIKSKYLERHITKNEASNFLDAIPVPAEQRDYLLRLWDIEHGAYTRQLTEAQTVKAVALTLITPEEGMTRLINMGYSTDDAKLLIDGA